MSVTDENNKKSQVASLDAQYAEIHQQLTNLAADLDNWVVDTYEFYPYGTFIGLDNVGTWEQFESCERQMSICIVPTGHSAYAVVPLTLHPVSISTRPRELGKRGMIANVSWVATVNSETMKRSIETCEPTVSDAVERVRRYCERMG